MKKTRLTSIAEVLERSFENLNLKARLKEYSIKKIWPEVVGKIISKKAHVQRLIKGTLYVDVSSQPWTTELMYQKASIIAKINNALGNASVQDIVFRPGQPVEAEEEEKVAVPKRQLSEQELSSIEKTVQDIACPSLRDSIKRAMEKSLSK
ncbi:MAG: DUF721 domain-containing protein [Deltaproteobacteria bacterium]|nr:DUF721 domain-containing protein [Deltaproteobacteria bacterium]